MTFTIGINKYFVTGTLKGLSYNDTLTYPVSSFQRVVDKLASDVASMRVIKGSGSAYVIRDFQIQA